MKEEEEDGDEKKEDADDEEEMEGKRKDDEVMQDSPVGEEGRKSIEAALPALGKPRPSLLFYLE